MLEWLAEEFERAKARLRPSHERWFRDQGVPLGALERAGGCGVARVHFNPAGGWEPMDDGGVPAILLPAYTPDSEGMAPILYDLVAFRPSLPKEPSRRRQDAVFLGEGELELAAYWHLPIVVRADPMSWLRANASGVVALDWYRAAHRLMEWEHLMGEDEATTAQLRKDLVRVALERVPRVETEPKKASETEAPVFIELEAAE